MKKFLIVLTILVFLFSLTACHQKEAESPSNDSNLIEKNPEKEEEPQDLTNTTYQNVMINYAEGYQKQDYAILQKSLAPFLYATNSEENFSQHLTNYMGNYGEELTLTLIVNNYEKLTAEEINVILQEITHYYDISDLEITEIVKVNTTLKIQGNEDSGEVEADYYLGKIQDKWYIIFN